MISRLVENQIKKKLFKGKLIIIYGARQVGKTTLLKKIMSDFPDESIYLNCEVLSVSNELSQQEPERLKSFFGNYKLILLDEAQTIPNIGKILKIINDMIPEKQIIATGSSSFDLASNTKEALTGRTFTFNLFPLSIQELIQNENMFAVEAKLEKILRFGSYPEVFSLPDEDAIERLNEIASNYLYKDVLQYEGIKKSSLIKNLLLMLALQIGKEVSYNELATKLNINRLTVQKYIDILEQSFIIFKLNAFSRNLRNEVTNNIKIYFYDTGIRNSLIQNTNPLNLRDDIGMLWENFIISERYKFNYYNRRYFNSYFWRTYTQKEVDYVEEYEGKIFGYEIKYSDTKKVKKPMEFIEIYKANFEVINRKNYLSFLSLINK